MTFCKPCCPSFWISYPATFSTYRCVMKTTTRADWSIPLHICGSKKPPCKIITQMCDQATNACIFSVLWSLADPGSSAVLNRAKLSFKSHYGWGKCVGSMGGTDHLYTDYAVQRIYPWIHREYTPGHQQFGPVGYPGYENIPGYTGMYSTTKSFHWYHARHRRI